MSALQSLRLLGIVVGLVFAGWLACTVVVGPALFLLFRP